MSLFRRLFGVPASDRPLVGPLFVHSFLTAAGYVLARTTGDSLLLSQSGPAALPQTLILSAIAVAAVTAMSVFPGRERSMISTALGTRLLLCAATALLAVLDQSSGWRHVAVSGLYVLAEIRGCVTTIQLTSLLAEHFHGRRARHSYGVVASGAPLAGVVMGTVMGLEAEAIGGLNWLFLACILDLLSILPLLVLQSRTKSNVDQNRPVLPWNAARTDVSVQVRLPASPSAQTSEIAEDRQKALLVPLSVLFVVKVLVLTFVAYQWKAGVSDYFGGDEESLTAYFAEFQAVTNLIILGLQLFLAGRILNRLGTVSILLFFPALMLAVGILLATIRTSSAAIVVLTMARGADVFRRALHDTALTVVYSALNVVDQRRFISLMSGVAKPAAEAAAGAILALSMAGQSSVTVTWIWLPLLPIWFVAAGMLGRGFRRLRREQAA